MDIQILQRALEREKTRRAMAEQILETKSRELYLANEQLQRSLLELERSNEKLVSKHADLVKLLNEHSLVTDDLRIAKGLQDSLLPETLRVGDIELTGFLQPAMYVAGDIYDYFMLEKNLLAFYMVDVSGHGAAAAMVSFAVHRHLNPRENGLCKTILAKSKSLEESVLTLLDQLNDEFVNTGDGKHYFTMVYGLLDLSEGRYVFSQAGHPAPIHHSIEKNTILNIGTGGFPVGLIEDASYTTCSGTLSPGDRLYIYSDGLTDLTRSDGTEFGSDNVFALIDSCRDESLDDSAVRIEKQLNLWSEGSAIDDDISLLVLQRDIASSDNPIVSNNTTIVTIPNQLDELTMVEQALEEFLSARSVGPELVASCTLAVSESICNIIKHGYSVQRTDLISVSAQLCDKLVVIIRDCSDQLPLDIVEKMESGQQENFNPATTDLMDIPESGWGLGFICSATETVDYSSGPDGNMLTLYFSK